MTALDIDDLVVVTGPLALSGATVEHSYVALVPGEVARVVDGLDEHGNVRVLGAESEASQWIDASSLTPLSDLWSTEQLLWDIKVGEAGDDGFDPLAEVHDYVWEGDE